MLFDPSWQGRFFAQLDRLMDKEEWEADDVPVTTGSFRTLMRLLLKLRDKKRPGLGLANQGHVVATWSAGAQDRLTIECLPDDRLWWIVSYTLDAGAESAAGNTSLDRIIEVLQPYDPGHWLNEGAEHSA
jgi:hypothetical protein